MKTFKSFINEAGPNAKPKAKGEADFVAAHKVEITDIENQEKEGSAKVVTKNGSGKRKADRLDNKQAMGEDAGQADARKTTPSSKEAQQKVFNKHKERMKQLAKEEVELEEAEILEMDKSGAPFTPNKPKKNPPAKAGKYGQGPSTAKHLAQMALKKQLEKMKEEVELDEAEKKLFPGTPEYKAKFGTDKEKHELKYGKSDVKKVTPYGYRDKDDQKVKEAKTYRKMMKEADFTKKQTTMAHTIGKEFEKKGVGDKDKGGPYAVASAMVRDKPEAAKKAYATIQSKMKEEADAELLFKLYDDLNEENQEFFMQQLEEDAEALLLFAQNLMED
jgi:hypothetical protein